MAAPRDGRNYGAGVVTTGSHAAGASRGRRRAASVLAALVLLGACTDGEVAEPAATSSTTTTAPPSSATSASSSASTSPPASSAPSSSTTGPPATFAGSTGPVSSPPAGPAYLTAVRTGREEGFDRVVFEFEGTLPGYVVGYADGQLTADGSGAPIPLPGEGALEVRMEQASGVRFEGSQVEETYTGPPRIPVDGGIVTEVVRAGDFEGQLTWGVGVRRLAPFRVSTLQGPPRVVVDVAADS